MTGRTWSHRELENFASGKVLTLWARGSYVPVPEWLLTSAEASPYLDPSEVTGRMHPEDRGIVSDWTIAALNNPGEVVRASYRYRWGDEWMRVRSELLCLTGPALQGMLTASVLEPLAEAEQVVGPPSEHAGADQAVHWMVETIDCQGRVLSVEGSVWEMLGRHPDDVVGRHHQELVHPDHHGTMYIGWVEMLHRPSATRVSRRCFIRPDGTEQWAECAYVNRLKEDGHGDVLIFATDITERMAQEEALRRTQEELRLLADQVPAAVFRADEDGRITFTNHLWRHLLGDLATVERVQDLARPDDRGCVDAVLAGSRRKDPGGHRVEVATARGRRRLAITLREVRDPVTGRGTFVGSVDDVTTTVALKHRADHDDLTGLLSRRAFEERVGAILHDRPGHGVLGFVDLDRFKDVNDTYGHDAGDAVLVTVARRLRSALREGDEIGRYGGDEFVVFCPAIDDGEAVADRMRHVCTDPVSFEGGAWRPEASIGVVVTERGEAVGHLLRRADQAMFTEKRRHRTGSAPVR